MAVRPTNWAGNVRFGAARAHRPGAIGQLQELVAASDRVRALGSGHSFNSIADTTGDLISLDDLPPTVQIDKASSTVTVGAAIRYGELAARLDQARYALHNLASLPHISVAGACATGTHGSGDANGCLATAVSAMELVTADGTLVTVSRGADGDVFPGMVVALGALGIVTRLTLDIRPAFTMRQWVYQDLPRRQLDVHFAEIFASGYSVSVFTDWRPPYAGQVWVKQRADHGENPPPSRWLEARLADTPLNPVPGMPAGYVTRQRGVTGPWHERLPHFRPDFTPSSGDELQSEYLVPRALAVEALAALNPIADRIAPVLQISEIRTVAADEEWLSPAYQRDSAAIHFTWRKDPAAVTPVLAAIEERLAPFAARPHWGKLFEMDPATLRSLYPRLPDFGKLLTRYDQAGKFSNNFIDRYVRKKIFAFPPSDTKYRQK
jgi:xylitol oxidase